MLLIVIGISYGVEGPLYPKAIEASDHSHAFDRYCSPYRSGTVPNGGFTGDILRRIKLETQTHEWFGISAIGILAACGGLLRLFDPQQKLDDWLYRPPATDTIQSRFDIALPAPVIGLCGLAGIIAISIAGCFAYYPEPEEALEELRVASIESSTAALSKNTQLCLHWIPICEGWNKRLIVGIYLREWAVHEDILARSTQYEKEIEDLEHMFQHRSFPSAIRRQAIAVDNARHALADALRRTGMIDHPSQ
ncbi:MAG: hypothetical protein MUP93_06395 [Pirellulales bacterium]|nr:hypothetical protein [Pirellulales bacterium]